MGKERVEKTHWLLNCLGAAVSPVTSAPIHSWVSLSRTSVPRGQGPGSVALAGQVLPSRSLTLRKGIRNPGGQLAGSAAWVGFSFELVSRRFSRQWVAFSKKNLEACGLSFLVYGLETESYFMAYNNFYS